MHVILLAGCVLKALPNMATLNFYPQPIWQPPVWCKLYLPFWKTAGATKPPQKFCNRRWAKACWRRRLKYSCVFHKTILRLVDGFLFWCLSKRAIFFCCPGREIICSFSGVALLYRISFLNFYISVNIWCFIYLHSVIFYNNISCMPNLTKRFFSNSIVIS